MSDTTFGITLKFAALLLLSLFLLNTPDTFAQNHLESGFLNKQQALEKLGNRLSEVAAKHGKSASELRRLFQEDAALHVDANDRLLYIDQAGNAAEIVGSQSPSLTPDGPFPYSQTFLLHSRPGANRVIYLDFDGHTTGSGNAWNSAYNRGNPIVAAPFSIDGDPNSFSDAERDVIQAVWQRVAEDYAAFDVDVTTEYPGESAINCETYSDTRFGVRVAITATNFIGAGVGGVAYLDIFNVPGNSIYQPAWVFSASLGNSDKNIAEAASHEAGHTLGLNHDGTASAAYYSGHGVWAPIMGVGYNRSISQWSRGEYPGANNTEDDLSIIQSNGLNFIGDDFGNTRPTAHPLSGTSIDVSGLITTRTDVDVFKFTTGTGNVSININPAARGGNLDIKAQLLDSAGNVLATSDPSSYALSSTFPAGVSAGFNQTLSAGTYYLTVDGAGSASDDPTAGYSDYSSIGQYTVTGTLASGGGTNQTPVASAAANVYSGFAPLAINFSSAGSYDPDGSIVSYNWNFGNGAVSTQQNPSYTYNAAGSFTVTLTVTDNGGLTNSRSFGINVSATQQPGYTAQGQNIVVAPISSLALTFGNVTGAGITSATPLQPNQIPALPNGYTLPQNAPMYDITTSASYVGSIVVKFDVPGISDSAVCAKLRVLHFTNNAWETSNNATPVYNSGICTVQQTVIGLSPFVVAQAPLTPTAASVGVSGRVMTADGRGLKGARVVLTDGTGATKTVLSGTSGNYRFEEIGVGQTITVQVFSKRFSFAPQTIYLTGEINEMNFTGTPQ